MPDDVRKGRTPAEIRRQQLTPGAREIGGPLYTPPGRLPKTFVAAADKHLRFCKVCKRRKTFRSDIAGYVCLPCLKKDG